MKRYWWYYVPYHSITEEYELGCRYEARTKKSRDIRMSKLCAIWMKAVIRIGAELFWYSTSKAPWRESSYRRDRKFGKRMEQVVYNGRHGNTKGVNFTSKL